MTESWVSSSAGERPEVERHWVTLCCLCAENQGAAGRARASVWMEEFGDENDRRDTRALTLSLGLLHRESMQRPCDMP